MRPNPALTFIAAWCVPGAGHFLVGRVRKALVFFVVLTGMFVLGLRFGGGLFPFEIAEPLVFLGRRGAMGGAGAAPAGLASGRRRRQRDRDHLRVRQHVPDRCRAAEYPGCTGRIRRGPRSEGEMTTHLGVMVLFAACVSAVFGTMLRDQARDQLRLGGRIFARARSWRLRGRLVDVPAVLIAWAWRWGPAIAQMAAIFVLSSQSTIPDLPGGLSNHTGHFIGYGMLGALALRGFAQRSLARRARRLRVARVRPRVALRHHRRIPSIVRGAAHPRR